MNKLLRHKIVAVIRANNCKEAITKAQACVEGGIKLIEITFSFPQAIEAIKELKKNPEITIGAGTVLNTDQAKAALEAGAEFIVSPHIDEKIIEITKSINRFVISGASTSNEIVLANKLGADMVKVFPAGLIGGPEYIKAIKEPLNFVDIFVTGGINIENFIDYITAGASMLGISSSLFKNINYDQIDMVRQRAQKFVQLLNK